VANAGNARSVALLQPGDRVVIIGAGPAGLTAAYLLAKDGIAVTVLEGNDTVGGLSQTRNLARSWERWLSPRMAPCSHAWTGTTSTIRNSSLFAGRRRFAAASGFVRRAAE